jgi:hypothetical protein
MKRPQRERPPGPGICLDGNRTLDPSCRTSELGRSFEPRRGRRHARSAASRKKKNPRQSRRRGLFQFLLPQLRLPTERRGCRGTSAALSAVCYLLDCDSASGCDIQHTNFAFHWKQLGRRSWRMAVSLRAGVRNAIAETRGARPALPVTPTQNWIVRAEDGRAKARARACSPSNWGMALRTAER